MGIQISEVDLRLLKEVSRRRKAIQDQLDQIREREADLRLKVVLAMRSAGATTIRRGSTVATLTELKISPDWRIICRSMIPPRILQDEHERTGTFWSCDVMED